MYVVILYQIFLASVTSLAKSTPGFDCGDEITRTSCGNWTRLYPDTLNTGSCSMKVHENSSEEFRFKILTEKANFIRMRMNFLHNESVERTRCVVQPFMWLWTYSGSGGARQYLNWPMEYSVWSLGLLDAQTFGPININIIVNGNCCITIGEKNTTARIAVALRHMADSLDAKDENEKHRRSFFCYKERIYLEGYIYSLCLHIICPVEAIGYRCCHIKWDHARAKYITTCPGRYYYYDSMWWIIPFLIGVILYLYVPIILFKLGESIKSGMGQHRTLDKMKLTIKSRRYQSINAKDEQTPHDESNYNDKAYGWIFESPVSMGAILSRPFRYCFIRYPFCSSRLVRFLFALMTMSVICFKIGIHGAFQKDFIVDSVKQGVPMDFLSVFAGYKLSKENFMRHLGGPYIACGIYLFLLIVSLCLPKDFSSFIERGLPNNPTVSMSLLTLDMTNKFRYGSNYNDQSTKGYKTIYKTMILHFVMLLNPNFWEHMLKLQKDRWFGFTIFVKNTKTVVAVLFYVLILPIYVAVCLLEIILCILYYGLPIVFWAHLLVRAYCLPIWRKFNSSSFCWMCFGGLLVAIESCLILYLIYMFSIVFVDSFVFISRVIVFTYTGLFAYPSLSFGYIIFGFSVIMYGTDSLKSISKVYCDLFERTKLLCKKIHDENPKSKIPVLTYKKGYMGIPRDLFQFVLGRHRPIRIEVFMSILKISILIFILYVSVSLLHSFKSNHTIHILTEAISTIFLCFIPKLLKEICVFNKNKRNREFDWALEDTIRDFRVMKYHRKFVIPRQESDDSEVEINTERSVGQNRICEEMRLLDNL